MRTLNEYLYKPVTAESLVFFRVAFGLIIFWDAVRHFQNNLIARYWLEPIYNFKYTGFAWVNALPAPYLYALWVGIALAGVAIVFGLYYRFATLYLTLTLCYFFLLEETRYLNHSYLIILICFWLIFLPLNQVFSLDARRLKTNKMQLPHWVLLLLQFHIALPYFFGGIAKLQSDWLHGQPLGLGLKARVDYPVLGKLFSFDWTALVFSYSGLFIDLLAVPLLLWKRSRPFIFVILVSFHYLNSHLFTIDVFPWFMIVGTSLFFEPDWPSKLYHRFRADPLWLKAVYLFTAVLSGGLAVYMHRFLNPVVFLIGGLACSLCLHGFRDLWQPPPIKEREAIKKSKFKHSLKKKLAQSLVALYIGLQLLLPLRHYLIPGDSLWTEEGHRFAWHMMLRVKQGSIHYIVENLDTGEKKEIDPADYLAPWQLSRFEDAPHLIHEFARYLSKELSKTSTDKYRIRARTLVSLNGRPAQPIIDSSIDLAKQPEAIWHASWILPLREPLP